MMQTPLDIPSILFLLVPGNLLNLPNNCTYCLRHANAFEFFFLPQGNLLPQCVYWNYTSLEWLGDGCSLDRRLSTRDTTVCACDHLTNFAIIFGADENEQQQKVLEILSAVLGAISCGCLAAAIFTLHVLQ